MAEDVEFTGAQGFDTHTEEAHEVCSILAVITKLIHKFLALVSLKPVVSMVRHALELPMGIPGKGLIELFRHKHLSMVKQPLPASLNQKIVVWLQP